ncbi:unnamed protein product [Staurois parvus]|uniref:Uncharacterized protein n=1 Tax=Staurois parvus TaxID=386267 RepID=A0ABN9FT76_9NEOB|nr:unnamed protein product [Staurois parvus]
MICGAPAVPPVSAHHCHINATYECPSELPFSVTPSVPVSASYQCQSLPPISAHQYRLSVASQCRL